MKANNSKKKALIVLCVILALIFLLILGATIWYEMLLNRINRVEGTEPTLSMEQLQEFLTPEQTDAPEPDMEELAPEQVTEPSSAAAQIEKKDHLIHILLVGQDRRPGEGRQRSDAMILCTINKETKTLTMTSFLRDLYVSIPGYYNQRLNVAYPLGGFKTLNDTLSYNFGIRADHNIEVDFTGFEKIIDTLGGVNIRLTEKEAAWMNSHGNPDMGVGGGEWDLKPGVNKLDGVQALAYSRIRKLDSDFNRTSRQRIVLMALLERCRNMNLTQLYRLVENVFPLITTDMSNGDITRYVVELFPLLRELTIETQHIPAKGTYRSARVNGMAVLLPDLEANQQILKDAFEN